MSKNKKNAETVEVPVAQEPVAEAPVAIEPVAVEPSSETAEGKKQKGFSKAVRDAIEALGDDVPYAAIIKWVKEFRDLDVNAGHIGNVKSQMKKKADGSSSETAADRRIDRIIDNAPAISAVVEGVNWLKTQNEFFENKEVLRDYLQNARKFLAKFSDADIQTLLELI